MSHFCNIMQFFQAINIIICTSLFREGFPPKKCFFCDNLHIHVLKKQSLKRGRGVLFISLHYCNILVKRDTWIKKVQKLAKVDFWFSFNKITRWYICCTFWVGYDPYFPQKNIGWRWCRKFVQNYSKCTKKNWSRSRSGLIFCRMKILTMPRKKFKIAMLNEADFMVKRGVKV